MGARKLLRVVKPEVAEALALVAEGKSPSTAARENGLGKGALLRVVRSGTIELPDGKLYERDEDYLFWEDLVERYKEEKLTLAKVREMYRVKPVQLRKALAAFGVREWDNRIPYDRSSFREIKDEASAYWLGFIVADGGIYKQELRLKLSSLDSFHLTKFCEFVGVDPDIAVKTEMNSLSGKHLSKVVLSSMEIVNNLKRHGIDYRKSGRELIPRVEDRLKRHLLRGIFDGDGCIRSNFQNVSLVGSFDVVSEFATTMATETGVREPKIHHYGTWYKAHWYSESDKKSILEYLYGGASVYLQRKYELARRFCRLGG